MMVEANSDAALHALLAAVAVARLDNGWIRVSGEDRVRWLNGMVTNSIQALRPGEGCYNFVLNAQGRIQGDLTAWLEADSIRLETAGGRVDGLIALLDRFIIMDDVVLEPVAAAGLLVAGPDALALLESVFPALELGPGLSQWQGPDGIRVLRARGALVPRYEVWAADEAALEALMSAAPLATEAALEELRMLEGEPRYGVDIRDKDLAQETALPGQSSPALHFSKGCYLGQEIVERVRSRGSVHRTLAGFVLEGELPAPGTALESGGKPVGELTSVASLTLGTQPLQLGLGIVRREVLPGPLVYKGINARGSNAAGIATQVTLPYRAATAQGNESASESELMRASSL